MVDDSIMELLQREPKWQVGYLESVAIAHYGYQPGTIAAKNKYIRAQTAMEAYLAKHPDDAYTCSKLGALYVQMQERAQGIALLEKALPLTSEKMVLYELHYHLGIAYSRQGNLPKAQDHYQSAAELPIMRKLKIGAYNNWGNLRKESGNIVGAIMLYQQTLEIDPSFAVGYYNLGMAWKQLGRLDDAISSYQQAVSRDAHPVVSLLRTTWVGRSGNGPETKSYLCRSISKLRIRPAERRECRSKFDRLSRGDRPSRTT